MYIYRATSDFEGNFDLLSSNFGIFLTEKRANKLCTDCQIDKIEKSAREDTLSYNACPIK